ncbi:uncharacterized protein LOC114467964 [Gouania willdenowi]|uniref:Uncharacterized LOC114467964 n=1 Tax=Gouania willdenowi TaxID=441366 RepID=A0A8C5N7A3_GOUWI|nr:uncharacterized protein LOC114467964 [Gouania willdenowi]
MENMSIVCMVLLLAPSLASAVQTLKTLNDLHQMYLGKYVPKHTAVLLYWFTNTVDIDNNHNIWLTFDPNSGEYGSHHYGNYERLLDPLPLGHVRYQYYTVGNINHRATEELPHYVVDTRDEYNEGNINRIIFRVIQSNLGRQRIDQVYITQHYRGSERSNAYDPQYTFQVHVNLLRQIREFSSVRNQMNSLRNFRDRLEIDANDFQLRDISNIWGDVAGLGLFLFIVFCENYSYKRKKQPRPAAPKRTQPDYVVNIPERGNNHVNIGQFCSIAVEDHNNGIILKVTVNTCGKAKIIWKNIPLVYLREKVMVVLYKNDNDDEVLAKHCIGNKKSGTYETSISVSDGFQVRLHAVVTKCFFWSSRGRELQRGPEFESPKPVDISNYNAKLQLFVEDGKACARIYVKKTFYEWMSEFEKSWVGFYSSAHKATGSYEWWQWQWVRKFKQNVSLENSSYSVYEYRSSMTAAPGVQIRFILQGEEDEASTPSWEEVF